MDIQDRLKQIRVEIDRVIKIVEGEQKLFHDAGDRELALVRTKLQEAKMWTGKTMEMNDSPLPEEFRDEYKGVGEE